jgi:hypothetical protein
MPSVNRTLFRSSCTLKMFANVEIMPPRPSGERGDVERPSLRHNEKRKGRAFPLVRNHAWERTFKAR